MTGSAEKEFQTIYTSLGRVILHPLLLIVIAGGALRAWNLDWGLPVILHPDEHIKGQVVGRILSGQLPDYLFHPGLMVNLAAAVSKIRIMFGAEASPEMYIFSGRCVSAALGALTSVLVYFLGKRVSGRQVGLFAAAAMAFVPINVIHSRYLKEDVYLVFCVVLATLLAYIWAERRSRRWFAGFSIAVGLCLASKFVGALMVLWGIGWIWGAARDWKKSSLLSAILILIAAVTFGAASPQAVLDMQATVRDVSAELDRGYYGDHRPALRVNHWPDWGTFFFWYGIAPGIGWSLALLGLAGFGFGLRYRQVTPEIFSCAIIPLLFYFLIELTPAKRGTDVERYVMPCVPFLLILAGWLLMKLRNDSRVPAWSASTVMVLLVVWPAIRSTVQTWGIEPDTRRLAWDWMAQNGPQEPHVLAQPSALYPGPWNQHSQRTHVSLEDKNEEVEVAAAEADMFSVSSFYTDRYTEFPDKSEKHLNRLEIYRSHFPYVHIIDKSQWFKGGFHNPRIEIRSKEPLPGMVREEEKD